LRKIKVLHFTVSIICINGDCERNKHNIINHPLPPTNHNLICVSYTAHIRVGGLVGRYIHYTHNIIIIIIHVALELIQIMRNTYYPENYVRKIDVTTTVWGRIVLLLFVVLHNIPTIYTYSSDGVSDRETLGNKVSFSQDLIVVGTTIIIYRKYLLTQLIG